MKKKSIVIETEINDDKTDLDKLKKILKKKELQTNVLKKIIEQNNQTLNKKI
jgi:hypothetical protein